MEPNLKKRGNPSAITSAVVAHNVRRLRREMGLDLAGLSHRLEATGRPISIPALSRLENNDRRVDVDDLMALAVALEVNTNALLLQPTIVGGHYLDLTGAAENEASDVWAWARGEAPLTRTGIPAHLKGRGLNEIREGLREAWRLEAEKFRARVSPGAPTDPGPGVSHLTEVGKGGETRELRMSHLVRPDDDVLEVSFRERDDQFGAPSGLGLRGTPDGPPRDQR